MKVDHRIHIPGASNLSRVIISTIYYYNLETFEGLLANLLLKKGFFESRTSSFPFIMFKNFDEQNDFKNYLIQNNFDLNIYEQIHQHNTTDPICYKKFIDLNSLSIYKEIYENKYQSYLKENFKK